MSQHWNAERYARNAHFVAELGLPVVDWLAPRPGERVLDLGCGDGALTEKLVALGCEVIAVDASSEQVAAARARGLDARLMDGQALDFCGEFDAVFSNAALHWMRRPDTVLAGVWRALRPRGRFVAEFGAGDNVKTIVEALGTALARRGIDTRTVNPWYFPSLQEYQGRLVAMGFTVNRIEMFARPTPLPGDIADWLDTFAGAFTSAVPDGERAGLVAEVRDLLAPRLLRTGGVWEADYVRLRFAAQRQGSQEEPAPGPGVPRGV